MRRVYRDYDPDYGGYVEWIMDDATGQLIHRRTQDLGGLLKENEISRNNFDGFNKDRTMKHVASIPTTVVEDLIKRGIWDDKQKLKAWLNDTENRAFRTSYGRV